MENLKQLSPEEINLLLDNARGYKTMGIVMLIAGPVAATSPFIFGDNMSLGGAGALFLVGTLSTLTAIPLIIVNSNRINRINTILQEKVFIEITPCINHDFMTHSNQTGLTLRFRF
ncbi:hypothetical protein [Maribellus sediminis]|uniref:hypothetical protein n=1 Tax=Maribellus sediminis TaxID=2696285 RepID=UPI001431BA8F|nr:hypothetical protein [Maribellus sediminis]